MAETETVEEAVEAEVEAGGAADEAAAGGQDDDYESGKIYCANCIHCKLSPARTESGGGRYALRIRCDAGRWKKKLGEEKIYKYCSLTRRFVDSCESYDAMGDAREFIRELRKTLAGKDEVYVGA